MLVHDRINPAGFFSETVRGRPSPKTNSAPDALEADCFPASYRRAKLNRKASPEDKVSYGVSIPNTNIGDFLSRELSLGNLEKVRRYLRFARARHAVSPLHYQRMLGRTVVITEQMDMHLL